MPATLDRLMFHVDGMGTVPFDTANPPWIHCKNLPQVEALQIGQRFNAKFQTGLGTTYCWVTRVE